MKTFIIITFLLLLLTACNGGASESAATAGPTAAVLVDDTAVLTDAAPVPNLGDEALLREMSSDNALYVLLDGQAVIQVYNTTDDTAVSSRLAEIAIDTLTRN